MTESGDRPLPRPVVAKPKPVPHCQKCDQDHYNFAPCLPRQDKKPEIVWRTNTEAWTNRLIDLKHLGGNTFVQRRDNDR